MTPVRPAPACTVRAFAKINLDLRVGGVQPDGYHTVRTVLQSLRLHDTLAFTPRRGGFVIACDAPGVPLDARNITPSTHLLFIAKNLERIGDHCTNMAETVHYLVTGEELPAERPKADLLSPH